MNRRQSADQGEESTQGEAKGGGKKSFLNRYRIPEEGQESNTADTIKIPALVLVGILNFQLSCVTCCK